MAELTRKAFHDLAVECRDLAQELARHEQDQVDVALCRRFNEWLPRLLAYDPLRLVLPTLTPARPLTRNMLFAAVNNNHGAVIQIGNTLSRFLAILNDLNLHLLARQNNRFNCIGKLIDVKYGYPLNFSNFVQIIIICNKFTI